MSVCKSKIIFLRFIKNLKDMFHVVVVMFGRFHTVRLVVILIKVLTNTTILFNEIETVALESQENSNAFHFVLKFCIWII